MKTAEQKQMITCPNCGMEFALSDAILKPLRIELQENLQKEYDNRFEVEKRKLEQEAIQRAEQLTAVQVKELGEQVEKLAEELETAQKKELEVRQEKRDLEKQRRVLELEVARKVDEEVNNAKKQWEDDHRLKDEEKEARTKSLLKQIEELKIKAEAGSQQAKGEVLELRLEDILRSNFPEDLIEPVPKGTRGADIIQKVNGKSGQCCGTIIWESKNTRHWSHSWINKLKENQVDKKAEIAAIASVVLPEEIDNFGQINDVWVTHWSFVPQLACALRVNLFQLYKSRVALEGRGHKMETLYDYLTSQQFTQRVKTIVGAFTTMMSDLAQEKQAMERIWNKREKQIESIVKGTTGMYGDLEGIIGVPLPKIEELEMPYQLEA